MQIKPLRNDLQKVIAKYGLEKKYKKQITLFQSNSSHPSLHTEKLHPKDLNIYSFRIDRKWRAIFVLIEKDIIEIVDINPHYE